MTKNAAKNAAHDLAPAPPSALDERGAPREGAYAGAIEDASLEGAIVPTLGRLLSRPGTGRKRLRGLRRKRWRFVGVFQDDLVLAAAVADVGYLGVAWAYCARGGKVIEVGWKSPGAIGVRAGDARRPSTAVAPGRLLSLAPARDGGLVTTIELPGLEAHVRLEHGDTPLSVVTDTSRGGPTPDGVRPGVTIKRAGVPARGVIELGEERIELDRAFACVDWTEAFFPRRMTWFWAAAAGRAADGRVVGLNLARGVHQGERHGEDALWLDGVPSALPPVHFVVRDGAPWRIRSDDRAGPGSVDLTFTPRGERKEDVDLGLVVSRYRQPFGSFTGTLRDARGREVKVEDLPGVTEHHVATW